MCTIFFPFLTLIKLSLSLSSSPLVLPHVSTWISLSTQGSSVFNKLKTHFNTADISRALRAFFIYRHNLNCSVETFQPCRSCSHRAALGVDRGQDRVLGVLPNGPLHWTCETLHLTQPLGTRLVCTCVHAGVCVYIVSKVTVLKVKNVGPLHAWQMDIFECKRENTDKTQEFRKLQKSKLVCAVFGVQCGLTHRPLDGRVLIDKLQQTMKLRLKTIQTRQIKSIF